MALYALSSEELIFASEAVTSTGYLCLECRGALRLRRAAKCRRAHFYHEQKSSFCRLYGKSERHETIQAALQTLYPSLALQLEVPFPVIGRIADLYAEKERLVFEVQCSWIREEEVERRTVDYHLLGIGIIWLLDDRIYNKKNFSHVEEKMRSHGAYFFTFSKEKLFPYIYDQIEGVIQGRRVSRKTPFWVDLGAPRVALRGMELPPELPNLLAQKMATLSHCFLGDTMDVAQELTKHPEAACEMAWLRTLEKAHPKLSSGRASRWLSWVWHGLDWVAVRLSAGK